MVEAISMSEQSAEAVIRAVKQVEHPEISRSVDELGMIRDVALEGNQVKIILALPFPTIPILDLLVELLREAVLSAESNAVVQVETVEMSPDERDKFLKMANEGWKLA